MPVQLFQDFFIIKVVFHGIKKGRSDVKMYFVRNNPKDCLCERHRIKIPTLGWVRLKEKGYIPTSRDGYIVKSGTISMKAGRYYVSALVEVTDPVRDSCFSDGVGIDLGLKSPINTKI